MRRLAVALLIACGSQTAAPKPATQEWKRVWIPIDAALVDRIIFAIAMDPTDRAWLRDLQIRRANAPDEEVAPIDRAIVWAEHPFTVGRDVALAKQIGDGFAAAHPDNPCIGAIIVDITPFDRPDALVDTFVKCFPNLARAHQYAGEKCAQMPDVPEARESQIVACARSFERCIELDAHHPTCAKQLGALQSEWTAPFCTTASLTPKLRAEFKIGPTTLDVGDFAYAVQSKPGVRLVLSARGRKRVRAWFDAVKSLARSASVTVTTRVGSFLAFIGFDAVELNIESPTPADVCDQIQQRKISDFP